MAEVKARVTADTTAFKKGLDSAKSVASKWATDVGKMFVGAFAVTRMMSFFSSFASELDRVGKLATRLDVLPSTIANLGKAAEIAGTDVEQVVKAMGRLTLQAAKSGDAFTKAGVDASKFLGSNVEGQVMMLAEAYQNAGGDASKLLAIQELLGNRSQELLPLIKQGPEALAESMGKMGDSYDSMVRKVEAMNDFMTKVRGKIVGEFAMIFEAMQRIGIFAKGLFAGGFDKAMDDLAEFEIAANRAAMAAKKGSEVKMKSASASAAVDELKAAEKAFASVGEMLEKRALERMSSEEKILALQEKQLYTMQAMEDVTLGADERAKAAKETLDIQAQIEAAQKEMMADEQRMMDEKIKAEEAVAKAQARVAQEEDRQSLAAMSPADLAKELQSRQADLFARSKEAANMGGDLEAAELKLEGLQLADAIAKALADAMPEAIEEANETTARSSVVSSSLAAVGGGGGSFVAGMAPELIELKNQTRLLEQIANNSNIQTTRPERERF